MIHIVNSQFSKHIVFGGEWYVLARLSILRAFYKWVCSFKLALPLLYCYICMKLLQPFTKLMWCLLLDHQGFQIMTHGVVTSVGLVSSSFHTIQVSIVKISQFLLPVGYGYSLTIFCFQYHSGLYTMQEPSYLGRIAEISIWFRMVLTQMVIWIYTDSLTLTYPPHIKDSLIPLLMFIIDTMHSPIFQTETGYNTHSRS